MSITFADNRFHLTDGSHFSRVLAIVNVEDRLDIEELYDGAALPQSAVNCLTATTQSHCRKQDIRGKGRWLYPTAGGADYRISALKAVEADGTWATELNYDSYEIVSGKPQFSGMPQAYTESDAEADTLILRWKDHKSGLVVEHYQTVMIGYHALCAHTVFKNEGKETLSLEKEYSCALNVQGKWDMLHLHGSWAQERNPELMKACYALRSIESSRGASGHGQSPFAALLEPGADEFQGRVIGISLVYSGSFRIEVEQDEQDITRLVAGMLPCRWQLYPKEELVLPEAVLAFSGDGLNGMSQIYHRLYRERLCRGIWRDRPRPVLCNNWEATYFDFNEEKLLRIASTAADLGVELFVLDDGWFGKRNDDTTSLGDWFVNYDKLPNGVRGVSDKIHAMGMKFGLWVEPEMVNPVSQLYEQHPDWCIHAPGRRRTQSRQQLILDLTRKDVCDYISNLIISVLTESNVDYVKWDMNRNFAEIGSELLSAENQGEFHHRYILGVYNIMDRITSALPNVLFEGCASGGGRFDAGILYYMPQFWTSDDTDAVERLGIQYGTSIVFPASTMGAHVSASPNHQVGRKTSMRFRGDVALSGNMGYELDLSKQTEEDKQEIRRQIAQVKQIRTLTQRGRFTRLCSPFEGRYAAWQFASEDKNEVLVCVFCKMTRAAAADTYIRVKDIDTNALYQDDEGNTCSGAVLSQLGVCIEEDNGGYRTDGSCGEAFSKVIHLRKV